MTNLSPAAQAVLDGFRAVPTLMDGPSIAGARRAVADQVVPEHREHYPNTLDERYRKVSVFDLRNQILAIAAELETQ